MDKIIIEDLQVYAFHGVAPEEKKLGQMFTVSLEVFLQLDKAAETGNLDFSINYAQVCDAVQEVLQSKKYDLLETAALKIIERIFEQFQNAAGVKVKLKKPWAPMGHHLKYAGVELERKRGEKNE